MSMVRQNVTLPEELKASMDEIGDLVNWSSIAATAFRIAVDEARALLSREKGDNRTAAMKRLAADRQRYMTSCERQGEMIGTLWAENVALYAQLSQLRELEARIQWEETWLPDPEASDRAPHRPSVEIETALHLEGESAQQFWSSSVGLKDMHLLDSWHFTIAFRKAAIAVLNRVEEYVTKSDTRGG